MCLCGLWAHARVNVINGVEFFLGFGIEGFRVLGFRAQGSGGSLNVLRNTLVRIIDVGHEGELVVLCLGQIVAL